LFFGGHTEFAFHVVFARQGVARNAAATTRTIVSVQIFFIGRLSFFEITVQCASETEWENVKVALIIEGCPGQIKRNLKRNSLLQSAS
jgi:hypothetical protein